MSANRWGKVDIDLAYASIRNQHLVDFGVPSWTSKSAERRSVVSALLGMPNEPRAAPAIGPDTQRPDHDQQRMLRIAVESWTCFWSRIRANRYGSAHGREYAYSCRCSQHGYEIGYCAQSHYPTSLHAHAV